MASYELIICSNKPSEPFARTVAGKLNAKFVELKDEMFSDSEPDYQLKGHLRGADVFYFCQFHPDPMYRLAETTIVGDALRYASPRRLTLVPTYLGFMKKDWKSKPHEPISIRAVAQDIEKYANRVLTMDMHSKQIQGIFRLPLDHLESRYTLTTHFSRMGYTAEDVIAAPDIGAVKRAHAVAELTGFPMAVVYELRDPRTGEKKAHGILGNVERRRVILIDDQVASAQTLEEAACRLREEGRASEVLAYGTHAIMTEKEGVTAEKRIEGSALSKLYVTDTIWRPDSYFETNDKIERVSVIEEFTEAVRRIHNDESLSELFGNS